MKQSENVQFYYIRSNESFSFVSEYLCIEKFIYKMKIFVMLGLISNESAFP